VLRLRGIGTDGRAGLPDLFDHLRLGELGVVEGNRHHAAQERRPRPADAGDLLGLPLQLLLRRPGRTPGQLQERLAVLLVALRGELLGHLAHAFVRDHPRIEVDRHGVVRRVDIGAHDPGQGGRTLRCGGRIFGWVALVHQVATGLRSPGATPHRHAGP
jgi:hypothetical protein